MDVASVTLAVLERLQEEQMVCNEVSGFLCWKLTWAFLPQHALVDCDTEN